MQHSFSELIVVTIWKQRRQQLGSNLSHKKMSRPPTARVICQEDNWSPLCHVSPRSCTLSFENDVYVQYAHLPAGVRVCRGLLGGRGGSTWLSLSPFI